MNPSNVGTGGKALGRRSRRKWAFRIALLTLCTASTIGLGTYYRQTHQAWAFFGAVISAMAWSIVLFPAIRTPRTAAYDDHGIEVQTLFVRWHYPWANIAAIRTVVLQLEIVPMLRFTKTAARRSNSAEGISLLFGGDGRLPYLEPDELDMLSAALEQFGSPSREARYCSRDAETTKLLIGRCEALGDLKDVTSAGQLASIDLSDYETKGQRLRESIQAGDWPAAAAVCEGTPAADWAQWWVVERANGQGAILEILCYADYMGPDSECRVFRTLNANELSSLRPILRDRTPLMPEDSIPS